MADEGLVVRPSVVRDDRDFCVIGINQTNLFSAVGQSVADAPVVGIDGDGESRRVAAAEEDDVRAGFDDGVGWELEETVRRLAAVAQPPAAYIDGC